MLSDWPPRFSQKRDRTARRRPSFAGSKHRVARPADLAATTAPPLCALPSRATSPVLSPQGIVLPSLGTVPRARACQDNDVPAVPS